jgi:hypothetical protein
MTVEELATRLETYGDPDSIERAAAILRVLGLLFAAHEDMTARIILGCPLPIQMQLGQRVAHLTATARETLDTHLK